MRATEDYPFSRGNHSAPLNPNSATKKAQKSGQVGESPHYPVLRHTRALPQQRFQVWASFRWGFEAWDLVLICCITAQKWIPDQGASLFSDVAFGGGSVPAVLLTGPADLVGT